MNQLIILTLSVLLLGLICFTKTIPTLNLSGYSGCVLVLIISLICVVLIYRKNNIKITNETDKHLLVIRYLHYCVLVLTTCYVFIFSAASDTIFLIFMTLLSMHWMFFKGECCLTYFEKKITDPTYTIGSRPYHHIWLELVFGKYLDTFMVFMTLAMFFNAGIVIVRTVDNVTLKWILIMTLLFINIFFNMQRFSSEPNV